MTSWAGDEVFEEVGLLTEYDEDSDEVSLLSEDIVGLEEVKFSANDDESSEEVTPSTENDIERNKETDEEPPLPLLEALQVVGIWLIIFIFALFLSFSLAVLISYIVPPRSTDPVDLAWPFD